MQEFCRTCLKLCDITTQFYKLSDGSLLSEQIKSQLESCIPQMTLNIVKNPVICIQCVNALSISYNFKTQCLTIEESIYDFYMQVESADRKVDIKYISNQASRAELNTQNLADEVSDYLEVFDSLEEIEPSYTQATNFDEENNIDIEKPCIENVYSNISVNNDEHYQEQLKEETADDLQEHEEKPMVPLDPLNIESDVANSDLLANQNLETSHNENYLIEASQCPMVSTYFDDSITDPLLLDSSANSDSTCCADSVRVPLLLDSSANSDSTCFADSVRVPLLLDSIANSYSTCFADSVRVPLLLDSSANSDSTCFANSVRVPLLLDSSANSGSTCFTDSICDSLQQNSQLFNSTQELLDSSANSHSTSSLVTNKEIGGAVESCNGQLKYKPKQWSPCKPKRLFCKRNDTRSSIPSISLRKCSVVLTCIADVSLRNNDHSKDDSYSEQQRRTGRSKKFQKCIGCNCSSLALRLFKNSKKEDKTASGTKLKCTRSSHRHRSSMAASLLENAKEGDRTASTSSSGDSSSIAVGLFKNLAEEDRTASRTKLKCTRSSHRNRDRSSMAVSLFENAKEEDRTASTSSSGDSSSMAVGLLKKLAEEDRTVSGTKSKCTRSSSRDRSSMPVSLFKNSKEDDRTSSTSSIGDRFSVAVGLLNNSKKKDRTASGTKLKRTRSSRSSVPVRLFKNSKEEDRTASGTKLRTRSSRFSNAIRSFKNLKEEDRTTSETKLKSSRSSRSSVAVRLIKNSKEDDRTASRTKLKRARSYSGDRSSMAVALFKNSKKEDRTASGTKLRRTRSSGRDRSFNCSESEYNTDRQFSVREHKDIDGITEKVFTCNICSYSTSRIAQIYQHQMTHSRPFKCKQSGCNYRSSLKTNVERHQISRHTTKMLYRCKFCDFGSAWKQSWQLHAKICCT